jgi:hypothetical protein
MNDPIMTEPITSHPLAAYVTAALALQGYQFNATQQAAIVLQFSRIEAVAQSFLQLQLPCETDAAPVFRP